MEEKNAKKKTFLIIEITFLALFMLAFVACIIMQFAASDPDYLERCNTIQKEFEAIEYNGGSEEW